MNRPLRDVASSLTLDAAGKIVDGALRAARQESLLPLAVAVLDSGGHLVALKREDGCGRLSNRPNFITAVAAASDGEFVPVPGGVLILDTRGVAIGAVGISGDTSDKDEYCAIQGVHAAGLASDPAEPNPEWKASGL